MHRHMFNINWYLFQLQHPNYSSYRSNFFFKKLALNNWALAMHFNHMPIQQGFFLGGGGAGRPPHAILRFRPLTPL